LPASAIGPSENAAPGYNGSFTVPQVTVDPAGHVTALTSKTITLPEIQRITTTSNVAFGTNTMDVKYSVSGDGVTTNSLSFGFTSSSLKIANAGSNKC